MAACVLVEGVAGADRAARDTDAINPLTRLQRVLEEADEELIGGHRARPGAAASVDRRVEQDGDRWKLGSRISVGDASNHSAAIADRWMGDVSHCLRDQRS